MDLGPSAAQVRVVSTKTEAPTEQPEYGVTDRAIGGASRQNQDGGSRAVISTSSQYQGLL